MAFGLTWIIGFQALLNILVATGLLPTTGVTLPFISHGGNSLLSAMIAVGILLNISKNTNQI
jgi:cell division protein FtsW